MVSDASPVLNKTARRSKKYGKIAKLKNLLQNAYRVEMHDTHFLRISYFVCGFHNSNSFYIPLFHSYKNFLCLPDVYCILYLILYKWRIYNDFLVCSEITEKSRAYSKVVAYRKY